MYKKLNSSLTELNNNFSNEISFNVKQRAIDQKLHMIFSKSIEDILQDAVQIERDKKYFLVLTS